MSEYPYFGVPPPRPPRPASEVKALRGKRVILSTPEGFVYDMRAASDAREEDGRIVVDVVTEEDWYRWMLGGQAPSMTTYARQLLWAE